MKKSLLFGLLAVLAAVFIFTACDNGTTTEYQYVDGPEVLIHIDTVAADGTELGNLLADPDYEGKVIGIASSISLTAPLEIPADYTVYLLNTGSLATASGNGLTVEGALWVGYGATLSVPSSADPIDVAEDGFVSVVTGGDLSIQTVASDITGEGSVTVTNGKLTVASVTDPDDIAAALALVNTGDLEVTTAAIAPSAVVDLIVPSGKKVAILAATGTETVEALTIPEGMTLAATGDLSSVTELIVNGTFTATGATLAAVTDLTVDGTLTAADATLVAVENLTVNGSLTVGSAATFAALTSLTVPVDATFNAGTAPLAALTELTVSGTLTADNATLAEVTSLTVNSTFAAPAATLAKVTSLTVNGTLTLDSAATLAALTSLTVPEGGTLNVGNATLAALTDLTVSGTLTASSATLAALTDLTVNSTFDAGTATLAAVTSLTVDGTLTASDATLAAAGAAVSVNADGDATLGTVAKLLASSVAAGGSLTVTEVTAFNSNDTLDVVANATVNGVVFPGATAISAVAAGELTIDNLNVPTSGELVIPESYEITVTGTIGVDGTLAFTDDSSILIIQKEGTLSAGAAAVFVAQVDDTADGSGVDLYVAATAAPETPTAFTSGNEAPIVLTTAAPATDGTGDTYIIGNASFANLRNVTGAASSAATLTSTAADSSSAAGSIKADASSAIVLKGASS